MDPVVKKKWLKALRSGKYRQGREFLCHEQAGDVRYCCLGVLYDVAALGAGEWESSVRAAGNRVWLAIDHNGLRTDGMLTMPLMHEAGLSLPDMNHLVRMNDRYLASFNEIANWIEEHL